MSGEAGLRGRGAEAVLRDHLRCWRTGTVEEDLERNYAGGVVLLTDRGRFCGRDGLRRLNEILLGELPSPRFEYRTLLTEGDVAFLEWSASSRDGGRAEGADTYLVRDGRIVLQTVHYTVTDAGREDT